MQILKASSRFADREKVGADVQSCQYPHPRGDISVAAESPELRPEIKHSKTCLVVKCGMKPYPAALRCQRALAALRASGGVGDALLLMEHPHTFSVGRNSDPRHLLWSERECAGRGIAVHEADRGGGITYHGPGQLVAYPIVHLGKSPDLHRYLRDLEAVAIRALAEFGVEARALPGLTGAWIGDRKIGSIGLKFVRGVAYHGISLNVACDLSFFDGIVACGLKGIEQTSLRSLGVRATVDDVGRAFVEEFGRTFGLVMIDVEGRIWGNRGRESDRKADERPGRSAPRSLGEKASLA